MDFLWEFTLLYLLEIQTSLGDMYLHQVHKLVIHPPIILLFLMLLDEVSLTKLPRQHQHIPHLSEACQIMVVQSSLLHPKSLSQPYPVHNSAIPGKPVSMLFQNYLSDLDICLVSMVRMVLLDFQEQFNVLHQFNDHKVLPQQVDEADSCKMKKWELDLEHY